MSTRRTYFLTPLNRGVDAWFPFDQLKLPRQQLEAPPRLRNTKAMANPDSNSTTRRERTRRRGRLGWRVEREVGTGAATVTPHRANFRSEWLPAARRCLRSSAHVEVTAAMAVSTCQRGRGRTSEDGLSDGLPRLHGQPLDSDLLLLGQEGPTA